MAEVNVKTHKKEGQEPEFAKLIEIDFAQVIANGVARIIREGPIAVSALEKDFDAWVEEQPLPVDTPSREARRKEVMKQVNNAKLALESIFIRVQQKL